MTNQQFIATLKPETCYKVLHWLFFDWGMQWTSTRDAIILWLGEEYSSENFERVKDVWGLVLETKEEKNED